MAFTQSHRSKENISDSYDKCGPNLVPRLFLRGRKDPGRSWSRATQILGGKLKKHLGRGGRVLRFEIYKNYSKFFDDKI